MKYHISWRSMLRNILRSTYFLEKHAPEHTPKHLKHAPKYLEHIPEYGEDVLLVFRPILRS